MVGHERIGCLLPGAFWRGSVSGSADCLALIRLPSWTSFIVAGRHREPAFDFASKLHQSSGRFKAGTRRCTGTMSAQSCGGGGTPQFVVAGEGCAHRKLCTYLGAVRSAVAAAGGGDGGENQSLAIACCVLFSRNK